MSEALEAHPVADLFPMLAGDELQDLAADIAERGLLQPIVLDADGRILDGRNRYAACAIAGVEPTFETYTGDDPDGYAVAVNIARRHLSKGQAAMVVARFFAAKKWGEKGAVAKAAGLTLSRVSKASTVLTFAPDLADSVVEGSLHLDRAYAEARERKKAKAERADQIESLRREAPDLADEVAEERLSLDQAHAQLAQRREDERRRVEVERIDAVRRADGVTTETFADRALSGAITWEEAATLARQWQADREESIGRDVARLERVAECWGSVRLLLDQHGSPLASDVLDRLGASTRQTIESIIEQIRSGNG